jgi:beta propeller repeat protein
MRRRLLAAALVAVPALLFTSCNEPLAPQRRLRPTGAAYDHESGTLQQITNTASSKSFLEISGDHVIWADSRSGRGDIYEFDLSTGVERQISSDTAGEGRGAVDGDHIVWERRRVTSTFLEGDIFFFDLVSGQTRQLTADDDDEQDATISGNHVVWRRVRDSGAEIFTYDLASSTTRQLTSDGTMKLGPRISENYIVWQQSNNAIYLYDLATGSERQIGTGVQPDISGNRVVWIGNSTSATAVVVYDIQSGTQVQIADPGDFATPRISGDRITFGVPTGACPGIELYDLATGTGQIVTRCGYDNIRGAHSISGTRIVWDDAASDARQVFVFGAPDFWTVTPSNVLLSDNFDGENGGVPVGNGQYTALQNFNITRGTIDLLGNGYLDCIPGNGLYLDLDGATHQAARLESKTEFALTPGWYRVALRVGNCSAEQNTLNLYVGSHYLGTITRGPGPIDFSRFEYPVQVTTAENSRIIIDHDGGDNNGLFLDLVEFVRLDHPPDGMPGGPYTGTEGTPVHFDASQTTDDDGDALTFKWDFGDGTTADGAVASHVYADQGLYNVTLFVSDAGGLTRQVPTTATISNAPPVVTVPADATIRLDQTASASASFIDPGANDGPWTSRIDWGDGVHNDGTLGAAGAVDGTHSYAAAGSYTVTVTVTDKDGATGTAKRVITVTPPSPGVTLPGSNITTTPIDPTTGASPATINFSSVTGSGTTSVTTSSTGTPPTNGFRLGSPPVYYEIATTAQYAGTITLCINYNPADFKPAQIPKLKLLHRNPDGTWSDVTTSNDLTAHVICGQTTSLSPFLVAATNQPPVAQLAAPTATAEGSAITASALGSFDPDGDPLVYQFDFGDGTAPVTSTTPAVTHVYADNGTRTITVVAREAVTGAVASAPATTAVSVANVPPALGAITGLPNGPISAGTPVTLSVQFSDPGTADTHTATLEWDVGTAGAPIDNMVIAESNGAGTASVARALTAGVYAVRLTVTDDDGGAASVSAPAYIVVYDPDAGFVTGGGWFTSPTGACQLTTVCAGASGRANFGFVSRYQRGATVPSGNTEFDFQAGQFRFSSTSYQWLVISGARAQYKGEGVVNGGGRYGFLLTAIDGDVSGGGGTDRLRLKVWDVATGAVVYDNQAGSPDDSDNSTALGGGSIVIHSN